MLHGNPEHYITPVTGCELHTRSTGWLTSIQRWGTRRRCESATASSHVAGCVGEQIIEATWPRVRQTPWETTLRRLTDAGTEWCLLAPSPPLTAIEKLHYTTFLQSRVGAWYSIPQLWGHFVDKMIAKVTNREQDFFAELINRVPDWVICSELQIKALIEAGRMLPEHANYDPDRLWDMRMTELVTGDWYILDHSYGWSDYMNA